MLSFGNTPACSTDAAATDGMTAQDIMAVARAEQDWRDGLSADENPFPPGTSEHKHYRDEFDRLMVQEEQRAIVAA